MVEIVTHFSFTDINSNVNSVNFNLYINNFTIQLVLICVPPHKLAPKSGTLKIIKGA